LTWAEIVIGALTFIPAYINRIDGTDALGQFPFSAMLLFAALLVVGGVYG